MDMHLTGKQAIVTGASKGIGLAIVEALLDEGVAVVAAARHVEGLPGEVHGVAVDLSSEQGATELVAAAKQVFDGGLDVLVNNVGGVAPRLGGFRSVSDEEWIATLALDFLSAVRVTRGALDLLEARGGGTIVSVNSVNATLADPLVIDYCSAKAALASFSKSLAKEVAPLGIRVNTVSPGPVATDLWLGAGGVAATVAQGGDASAVAAGAAAQSPTGRFTEPAEVADLVVLLASGRAGNVTGADFVIDGGLIPTH
ncbi:SDR family oxidoreductase [Solirubrobacter soli]|uniref:SDR family oxidoreductase n=1 Tax=Solirubrobacter soli TaxID=363832 RepID=UPI000419C089|nr:SDR family oxidoreductase [Solirubrobacter soli]